MCACTKREIRDKKKKKSCVRRKECVRRRNVKKEKMRGWAGCLGVA